MIELYSGARLALETFFHHSKELKNMNATAHVVEERMEPIQKAQDKPQTLLTGQYLYDTFMKPSEADTTRMQIVRSWAEDARYDPFIVGQAADAMVKRAFEYDAQAWTGKKNEKGVPVGPDGKKVRGVKEQSAMNVRGIIQLAYGALKFARAELTANGYDDSTGYQAMRVIAKKALDDKHITWTGEAQKTDADRERARLQKEQKTVIAARQEAMKNLPQNHGESDSDYFARLQAFSRQTVESAKAEAEQNIVQKLLEQLEQKHGVERMLALAQAICEKHGVSIVLGNGEQETEPTEQETLDAMANVPEEQAAH